jgi:hypothetical protein
MKGVVNGGCLIAFKTVFISSRVQLKNELSDWGYLEVKVWFILIMSQIIYFFLQFSFLARYSTLTWFSCIPIFHLKHGKCGENCQSVIQQIVGKECTPVLFTFKYKEKEKKVHYKIPLAPMGALAPGSAHTRPPLSPPSNQRNVFDASV